MANLGDMADDDGDVGSNEGIFGQGESIFSPGTPSDAVNPQVTRAQEEEPENLPGSAAPEPRRDLVFVQDALGRVKCAWSVDGNLVERFREPTPDELQLAPKARWRQVQPNPQQPVAVGMRPMGQMPADSMGPSQGVTYIPPGVQPKAAPAAAPSAEQPNMVWTLVKWGGIAWAGYQGFKWLQKQGFLNPGSEEATEEELAEAEDVEQVTEV